MVVFCIFKDALAVDAAHHDMINSCARLDAAFPWHDTILFGTLTCPLCPLLFFQPFVKVQITTWDFMVLVKAIANYI